MGRPAAKSLRSPFVGRAGEPEAIDVARRGGGSSAVLAGARSVGTTRLARAIADAAGTDGWTVDWAIGTEAARDGDAICENASTTTQPTPPTGRSTPIPSR